MFGDKMQSPREVYRSHAVRMHCTEREEAEARDHMEAPKLSALVEDPSQKCGH
mgnify:CR=1 FL=1